MKLCEFNWYMENIQEKRLHKIEDILSLAWYTAYFQRIKKLEPLKVYLDKLKPKKITNNNEISFEKAKEIYNKIKNKK